MTAELDRDDQYLQAIRDADTQTIDAVELRLVIAADWVSDAAMRQWPDPHDAPPGLVIPLVVLSGLIEDNDPLGDHRSGATSPAHPGKEHQT